MGSSAPIYRKLRADPPPGYENDYAVLYTSDSLMTAAVEARALNPDRDDNWTWIEEEAKRRKVARYNFGKPAMFIPLDGQNGFQLGLTGFQSGYGKSRQMAHALWKRYSHTTHGLTWTSKHRNQTDRVYAIWHSHKSLIDLELNGSHTIQLIDDSEWIQFLGDNPEITKAPASR